MSCGGIRREVFGVCKEKFWEIVFQWVFPCALLVVALVLSLYEFNNKMNSAIQTVVDDQAEQIGYYYSAGVDDKLGALGDITSAMANIMASRPDRSDALYMRSWTPL